MRPYDSAITGLERVQNSGGAKCVHAVTTEGRRPARTGAAVRLPKSGRVTVCPHRLAGAQFVAGDHLVGAALLLGVKKAAADSEGRPAWADRPAPQRDWRRC